MKTIYKSIKSMSFLVGLLALLFITSCGGGDDEDSQPDDANAYLNENVTLPAGSFTVSADQITEASDIEITSSGSASRTQVVGGQTVSVSIPFTAANSNVTHAGIRFGDSGDIIMIPVAGASGNSSGILGFEFGIPADICDNLNDICHDIRCYEFAVAESGNGTFQVSRENINELASACGGCDEPQCVALLGPECGAEGGDGNPRFNLTWSPAGTDLDLYVREPDGTLIGFDGTSLSSTGGIWDVDCTSSCTDENITWPDGGPSGTYQYYVNHFSGGTVSWQIRVFDGGRVVASQSGTISDGDSNTFSYSR